MSNREELLAAFFREVQRHDRNHRHGLEMQPDYYEPGDMENMDCYYGCYDRETQTVLLRTEVKGLRYEGRTVRLERLSIGDPVTVERDPENPYNGNNFLIKNEKGENMGNLSAQLCNALAPVVDAGLAELTAARVSYMERIRDRSRYARQGVLFLEMEIRMG